MTTPIKVTTGEIDALSERLKQCTRNMDEALGRLDGEVASLQGAWSGAALDAYSAAQRDWRLLIDEMKETLEKLSHEAAVTAGDYRQTSRNVGKVWGN